MLRRGAIVAAISVSAVAGVWLLSLAALQRDQSYCAAQPASFPAAGISGWSGEQLENAATIMLTARRLGFDRDGQVLGVMTAMGESSLRNIGHGDWETSGVTNPDGSRTSSIGLFQQQKWWGSVAERMDPATAATLFYARLGKLKGWRDMEPSHAINLVQVNADKEHYARFHHEAAEVVDALSGPCPAVTP